MRHGRKSRSRTIEGYKRFIARELDHGLVVGVTVQPANQREHEATDTLEAQVNDYGQVQALFIDRGFLASAWTKQANDSGIEVVSRPWNVSNGERFAKSDFDIDVSQGRVTCPEGNVATIRSAAARFDANDCDLCSSRAKCTTAKPGRGRSVSIHPQEALLQKLAAQKKTPQGRAKLRQRVPVEHSLAHICNRQGRNARYLGIQKNIFDLARYAVIENLFVADGAERAAA